MVQEEVVVPDTVVLPQCRAIFNSAEGLRFWGDVNVKACQSPDLSPKVSELISREPCKPDQRYKP